MFKCQQCNKSSRPGESPIRKVIETREYEHKPRFRETSTVRHCIDRGGMGAQIVREIIVCAGCAE